MSVKYTKLCTVEDTHERFFEDDNVDIRTRLPGERRRSSCDADRKFTVEEAVEVLGVGWFQFRLWAITGLFSMADACEMMLLAVLSPELRCQWGLSQTHVALITTVVFIGMGTASPFWGILADRYGRRNNLMLASVVVWYFGLLTSFSPSYFWLLLLRGLVGAGMAGMPHGCAGPRARCSRSPYLPS
ncbi:hypothetical protein DPMN_043030 [Dreissena polymorpha]|uniref:Major facilitator superfamily (MFS) profile domain-containing protein n=1 Tax=Dreissena polymorpha TaxID=45954 RepID=A0A9D4HXI8_DREPO|nr:hypothetical protein DPMN_043030 [Dreissena polymorpha]